MREDKAILINGLFPPFMATRRHFFVILVACVVLGFVTVDIVAQQPAPSSKDYLPPEEQASDPQVKVILEAATRLSEQGDYEAAFQQLQTGVDLCVKRGLVADQALVEARLGASYALRGNLSEARQHWLAAYSNAIKADNLVLQADALSALSSLSQTHENIQEALELGTKSLEAARQSKNLWIESRALGELGRIQFAAGKVSESRDLVEEALRIDRLNQYQWEASHELYLAWITATDKTKLEEAIQMALSARELAVKREDYMTFVQASTWLGQTYVEKGQVSEGIAILEHSRSGISEQGQPLFKNADRYRAATSLPLLQIVLLGSIAQAYSTGKRQDDAFKSWQELYEIAKTSGFTLAEAGAMHEMAAIYQARNNADDAASYYAQAAALWGTAGNTQRQINDLSSEASLLFQEGKKDQSVKVNEQIIPLAKLAKDSKRQFIIDLAIAEVLQPEGDLDRTAKALLDAESLVPSDLIVQEGENRFLLELYLRLANLHEKRNQPLDQLIALEKALTPAERIGAQEVQLLVTAIRKQLDTLHVQEEADKAYANGEFVAALTYSELLQYFEGFEAQQKGDSTKYFNDPNNQNLKNVLNLPFKIISQPDGTIALANNLEQMGPIVKIAKLPILQVLSAYYMIHQQPEKAAQFATAALPLLKLEERDQPHVWDGQLVCLLTNALLLEKRIDEAVQRADTCLRIAKKVNEPELLSFAHQVNVWVAEATGRPEQAADSLQFLTARTEDPSLYAQQAMIDQQEGKFDAAIAAWKRELNLLEARKDLNGMASTHLSLATALNSGNVKGQDDELGHAQAALSIYIQLKDTEGEARANLALAKYYAKNHDQGKAREHFTTALNLARESKKSGLEAYILDEIGHAYAASETPLAALEYYHKASDIYDSLKDQSDEALVLRDEAILLTGQHKTQEALEIALKAQWLADASDAWFPRFWTRWQLALLYGDEGEYAKSIASLQEARAISDAANQPQISAIASLGLTDWLITLGNWEEALKTIEAALPVFKKFGDRTNELAAYYNLIDIFGARESDLKDFEKALRYYNLARQLAGDSDPASAANLALNICEIYWQQGRFQEAIKEASAGLAYYKSQNDKWDQAGALITLAEAERSAGAIDVAAHSLAEAEPLVQQVRNFYMTGRLYYGQAGLMKAEKNYTEAIKKYISVIDLLEQFKSGSNDANLLRKVSENYRFIYDDLIDSYYQLSIKDKQSQLSSADEALRYSELNKSRVFTNTWGRTFLDTLRRQIPSDLQEKERALASRKSELQAQLNQALSGKAGPTSHQVQEDIKTVAEEQSTLEKQIRQANPAYAEARYPTPVSIQGLPLRVGEILVEFKMLNDGLLVWILEGTAGDPHLIAFYKVDHSREWFEDRILTIRSAFNRAQPDEFDPNLSKELFDAIFPEPFTAHLTTASSIIFVPDDILFLLPFEILSPNATTSSFTLLKTPTSYFPSAAAFRLARAIEHTKADWREQFLGIADPITSKSDPRYPAATLIAEVGATPEATAGDRSKSPRIEPMVRGVFNSPSIDDLNTRGYYFNRLPQTSTEVESIAALFPPPPAAIVRTGLDATKSKLLKTDLGGFRFIHFATHGFVPVEPGVMEPALVLSYDGGDDETMMLSLSEILQLRLHAEMVVLSACNTGSGKVTRAEGVASLGLAFLTAGSSSIVMSLWKVSDQSTAILMQEFYRNLLKGMPKSSALAEARETMISKGYLNPFFWAPFILTGE